MIDKYVYCGPLGVNGAITAMSTGGKVIVVLVTLLTIVWVGLMSMVARLNWNYGDQVNKGVVALEALSKQVADARVQLRQLEDSVENSHFNNDDDRTLLRLTYNDLEKTITEVSENLDRMDGLFTTLSQARTDTEANIAVRKKEVNDDKKKLADTTTAVETSKGLNAKLKEQLAGLREKFQQVSEANKALGNQVGKGSPIVDVSPGASLAAGL